MIEQDIAFDIVEQLRKGLPPKRGVLYYSVGNEKLIAGIKKFQLKQVDQHGLIRFINGSWGAGKTHFFRLLRDVAFDCDCLVSNVELSLDEAPLNRFEKVFYAILRNVSTASYYSEGADVQIAPFGRVVEESHAFLGTGSRELGSGVSYGQFETASEALMGNKRIDIDFKKMIRQYWETFLPESPEPAIQEEVRGEILQWFAGEGTKGTYRKKFGVSKMINRDNAKLMLQSLAGFVRLSGYRGLCILFDEAEQTYSIMRKSSLKDAHNNLLSLINNIEQIPGLFLIYATTPDFFTDPKHGIVIYGALAGRIGKPERRPPRALDTIWNFDEVVTEVENYQVAALKIRAIYADAFPEDKDTLPPDEDVDRFVSELYAQHSSTAGIRFWRVLVTSLIIRFDDYVEGEGVRPVEDVYDDVMDRAREE